MASPFDILNAINHTKVDMFRDDPLVEKDYVPFMINRGLSYFQDTVFLANEMNKFHDIDKDMQFYFLLNTITKRKRFSKWSKKEVASDVVGAVSTYYKCSIAKAVEFSKILSDDQINIIKEKLNTGGNNER